MYDPRNEHDACGVGFVATLTGEASHQLVDQALEGPFVAAAGGRQQRRFGHGAQVSPS